MRRQELGYDFVRNKGNITRKHDHFAGLTDDCYRRANGSTRSVRFGLDHRLDSVRQVISQIAVRRNDHGDAIHAGGPCGDYRPCDHRPAANRVEDLGQRRAHAGAFTRSHDQCCGGATRQTVLPVSGAFFEPAGADADHQQRPARENEIDSQQQADRPVLRILEVEDDDQTDDQGQRAARG